MKKPVYIPPTANGLKASEVINALIQEYEEWIFDLESRAEELPLSRREKISKLRKAVWDKIKDI